MYYTPAVTGDDTSSGFCVRVHTYIRTAEMEPGLWVTGSAIMAGSGRSLVSVSDPVFVPVLSFTMRVYRGIVSTE